MTSKHSSKLLCKSTISLMVFDVNWCVKWFINVDRNPRCFEFKKNILQYFRINISNLFYMKETKLLESHMPLNSNTLIEKLYEHYLQVTLYIFSWIETLLTNRILKQWRGYKGRRRELIYWKRDEGELEYCQSYIDWSGWSWFPIQK